MSQVSPLPHPPPPRVTRSNAELVQSLRKIERMVGRFLREARAIDPENLAADIWLDLWTRNVRPSWTHVHNKCVDVIRRATSHREVAIGDNFDLADTTGQELGETTEPREQLDRVMKCPWLTAQDKSLLYARYYSGQTDETIARALNHSREKVTKDIAHVLEKLRTWAFVMEQESPPTKEVL